MRVDVKPIKQDAYKNCDTCYLSVGVALVPLWLLAKLDGFVGLRQILKDIKMGEYEFRSF